MKIKIDHQMFSTNDTVIRTALRNVLDEEQARYRRKRYKAEIIEELGVQHGTARIDCAIIKGIGCSYEIHGYEIKSDLDSLKRLPEQVEEFNTVFDKLTLVVGKCHLYHAIHIIPDWWGITVAKQKTSGQVTLQTIRKPEQNKTQKEISIARLLWKEEALRILERRNKARGVRHKPREFVYKRLAEVFASDAKALKECVSSVIISRKGWRSDLPQVLSGD